MEAYGGMERLSIPRRFKSAKELGGLTPLPDIEVQALFEMRAKMETKLNDHLIFSFVALPGWTASRSRPGAPSAARSLDYVRESRAYGKLDPQPQSTGSTPHWGCRCPQPR